MAEYQHRDSNGRLIKTIVFNYHRQDALKRQVRTEEPKVESLQCGSGQLALHEIQQLGNDSIRINTTS